MEGEPGKISLFKMLRSSFSKGLEALLIELLLAARKAGLEKELWQEVVVNLMTGTPFDKVASNWIRTHPGACERRYHEMTEVVGVLRELVADPPMAPATEAFFKRSAALDFASAFPEKPASVAEVLDYMERNLGNGA